MPKPCSPSRQITTNAAKREQHRDRRKDERAADRRERGNDFEEPAAHDHDREQHHRNGKARNAARPDGEPRDRIGLDAAGEVGPPYRPVQIRFSACHSAGSSSGCAEGREVARLFITATRAFVSG